MEMHTIEDDGFHPRVRLFLAIFGQVTDLPAVYIVHIVCICSKLPGLYEWIAKYWENLELNFNSKQQRSVSAFEDRPLAAVQSEPFFTHMHTHI